MFKFSMYLLGLMILLGLGILVMIYGWGLTPLSWGWIIWGSIGAGIVGALVALGGQ